MAKERGPVPEESRFPDGFRILQGKQEYITYQEHASIRVWPSDQAGYYAPHSHSAVEIILPDRGVSVYQLQDAVYRVQAGEVLIVPPRCMHSLTEARETLRYLVLFEPSPLMNLRDLSNIAGMLQQPIYLHSGNELQHQVRELMRQLVECYFQKAPMWNAECYAFLMQMYALLGRQYLLAEAPESHSAQRTGDHVIMNTAVSYIEEHYMEPLSLETVAGFAGFSKYYFSRLFKECIGVSFSEYLIRIRLEAAADLLARTDQSIREVALASGFGSTATFNRIFREYKNCTPTQFRAIYSLTLSANHDKKPEKSKKNPFH